MVTVTSQFAVSADLPNWREVYKGALLESDRERLSLRIDEAERAILLRGRELFAIPADTSEEAAALDDALYALGALRTCLQLKTRESTTCLTTVEAPC
jgi:hypothetical protein